MELIQPTEKEIECQDGSTRTYVLSKFPAIAGREIITQYPITATPKVGDYKLNAELMVKLMGYVGVPQPDGRPPLRLTSEALVNNHVPDCEALMRLEYAMLEYNCSFFANGRASSFFEGLAAKAQALIAKTLTDLSQQSSAKS